MKTRRHAVSAPLALLSGAQIRPDRRRGRDHGIYRLPALRGLKKMAHDTFLGLRTHHVVIALIAIVIAIALASNYYLW